MNKVIGCLLAYCLLLTGCNRDRFVEDFLPEETNLNVKCNEPATVCFEGTDWDIQGVGNGDLLRGDVYYPNTDRLIEDTPLVAKGQVRMRYDDNRIAFIIERNRLDELKVTVEENHHNAPYTFFIQVGNAYLIRNIRVDVQPSVK